MAVGVGVGVGVRAGVWAEALVRGTRRKIRANALRKRVLLDTKFAS
jgi:hypothetical protein